MDKCFDQKSLTKWFNPPNNTSLCELCSIELHQHRWAVLDDEGFVTRCSIEEDKKKGY